MNTGDLISSTCHTLTRKENKRLFPSITFSLLGKPSRHWKQGWHFRMPLPIKWLPYHVDVNNIFCLVIGQLVQVHEGEVAVINCRKSILPSSHVVGKKQLITKRHWVSAEIKYGTNPIKLFATQYCCIFAANFLVF